MTLGEVTQISEGIYVYLQPDGSGHLDVDPAFAGMIAYNGGRPLTCHA